MFTVDASEIEHFDGKQLVRLLRQLLYAEARATDVPMRNVDVPLQITVADGGKDGSVRWQDGKDNTNFFPGRDVVFQCKATDHGAAQWKNEVWSKASKNKKAKVLNDAVFGVLDRGGSYIGVTATPLVGDKPKDRADAIRAGIREAGGDPAKLNAIDVYDGNKLAAWATAHPAVALWVKEQVAQMPLAGFATLEQWGKRADVARPAFVDSDDRLFVIGQNPNNTLSFSQLAGRLVDHLADAGACVRLSGPSGIGKTRALHQVLSTSVETLRETAAANFIFCDYREVSSKLWDLANKIANDGSAAVLVIDECPWPEARRLNGLAGAQDSQLRIVTIDTDSRDLGPNCLMISPRPADGAVIRGILAGELSGAKPEEVSFVAELCDGFPRIAVLAAQAYRRGLPVIKSADDVAERIIETAQLEREQVRALECLSLFERMDPDAVPTEFDAAAERLAHLKGELMYEHLVSAGERHLVGHYGSEISAQPRPIADHLALRRLNALRPSTVVAFLLESSSTYRDNMLARFRHLARSPTLGQVVQRMVYRGRSLSEDIHLLGDEGAPFLPAFVHVSPDLMAIALRDAIRRTPLDDLAEITVSDGLLEALRILSTRRQSFSLAASSLIHLAAAHGTEENTPVVERLKQLFQVALAGSEASDSQRKDLLAELLAEDDLRVKRACVEALGAMLTTYMTRFGDMDQVGNEPIRSEWTPPTQDAVQAYFRWSLERLLEVWRAAPELRARIQTLAAEPFRTLIDFGLFPTVEIFVRTVVAEVQWPGATKALGDWLYFDRAAEGGSVAVAVRTLYDQTLPADPVELALFYSRYWPADIRDPDARHRENDLEVDFRYAAGQVARLAPDIARDAEQVERVLAVMTTEEMHSPDALAQGLARHFEDPLAGFARAIAALDRSGQQVGLEFIRALLRNLERVLVDQPEALTRLVEIAKSSPILSANPMNIFTALRVTSERVTEIAGEVAAGRIGPLHVVPISYGRGLDDVSFEALRGLITALVNRTADGGAWAALEMLSMRTHDQKELDSPVAELVKLAIGSPAIADDVKGNATTADYVLERLIRMLAASNAIDDDFSEAFAQQIVRACRSDPGGYARGSDALRVGLTLVMEVRPEAAWAVLAGFFETATRLERDRLYRIIGSTKPFGQEESRVGPGALFVTPKQTMFRWADVDPEARASFLVSAYPILEQIGGDWCWHPEFQALADRYGATRSFRDGLRARILPASWGGSLVPHLEAFQAALAAWTDDPTLGEWATALKEDVDRWLEVDV
jgi:hypothetical protein